MHKFLSESFAFDYNCESRFIAQQSVDLVITRRRHSHFEFGGTGSHRCSLKLAENFLIETGILLSDDTHELVSPYNLALKVIWRITINIPYALRLISQRGGSGKTSGKIFISTGCNRDQSLGVTYRSVFTFEMKETNYK